MKYLRYLQVLLHSPLWDAFWIGWTLKIIVLDGQTSILWYGLLALWTYWFVVDMKRREVSNEG